MNPDGDNFQFYFRTSLCGQPCSCPHIVIPGAAIKKAFEPQGGAKVALNPTTTSVTSIWLSIGDTMAAGTHEANVNIDYLAT